MAGMKYKTIKCPFCDKNHAHITYEENRVYQLNCTECHNAIFHRDHSWDSAVRFFEHLLIVEDGRKMANEKLTEWLKGCQDYGIFAPPMEAQTAVDFLMRYLLGENWYSVNPVSTEQINTEIVHEILLKYSREYRKEWRKYNGK